MLPLLCVSVPPLVLAPSVIFVGLVRLLFDLSLLRFFVFLLLVFLLLVHFPVAIVRSSFLSSLFSVTSTHCLSCLVMSLAVVGSFLRLSSARSHRILALISSVNACM